MKKINILILTLIFMFSCSTVPVEEVDSQQATTVDLTSDSGTSSEAASRSNERCRYWRALCENLF